jgi:hypothetical protein
MPLSSLRGWLLRLAGCAGVRDDSARRNQIVAALAAAGRRMPFTSTCLVEALAAEAMLRRRGFEPTLVLGVARPAETRLSAHAWVEVQGEVVVGRLDHLPSYAVLRTPGAS